MRLIPLLVLSCLPVSLFGCSSDPSDPISPSDGGPSESGTSPSEGDAAASDGTLSDISSDGSTTSSDGSPADVSSEAAREAGTDPGADASCNQCSGVAVHWRYDGGLALQTSESAMARCQVYEHSSVQTSDGAVTSCSQPLTCQGGAELGMRELKNALNLPDVKDALQKAPILFGSDPRPSDGAVLQIDIGGKVLEVGGGNVPAGIRSLADLLSSIDVQELGRGACKATFPSAL